MSNDPAIVHQWNCEHSILSLAVWENRLIAGTERGQLLVYDLSTYQLINRIDAHHGSLFCLQLYHIKNNKNNASANQNSTPLLISSGSDSILKVWALFDHNGSDLIHELCTVYSVYDIGDIFCVATLPKYNTIAIGAQNATIQWFQLTSDDVESMSLHGSSSDRKTSPTNQIQHRYNKFFDSAGPGGRMSEAQEKYRSNTNSRSVSQSLEIPDTNYIRFAHNGYVYAMTTIGPASLVSGGGDGSMKIWSLGQDAAKSGSGPRLTLVKVVDLESSVLSLTHPPNTPLVYCGLDSGETAIYDMDVAQVVRLGISSFSEETPINTLCSGTESNAPVIQSAGGCVEFWDGGKKSEIKLHAHSGLILASAIASIPLQKQQRHETNNMQLLLTAGNDALIKLWNIDHLNDHVRFPSRIHTDVSARLDHDSMLRTLGQLVQYQTVSGHHEDDTHWDDFHECTKALRNLFTELGAESRLFGVEKRGHPIVYGYFRANCADQTSTSAKHKHKRILFYGHYDVISAEVPENWASLPFTMDSRDGYIYGRGVSDNKGPTVAAIYAAAELWANKNLANDIVFLIEGQEESGSPGFRSAVESHVNTVGPIDWILLSNSYWLDDTTPCLNYGLRGVINLRIRVSANRSDLHSGVHGGLDREPALDLIHLLSKITTSDQNIVIPGFHNDVRPVTAEERQLYDAIKGDTQTFMTQWRYPSVTLHRMTSSGPDPPNSTVIPASVEAWVSFRIVPDQECATIKKLVSEFLELQFAQLESTNALSIDFGYEAEPWLGNPSNEAFQTLKDALAREWNKEPVFTREGGSIPVVKVLEHMFDAPAVQLPCGQASDGAHLNNERLRITNLFATRRILTSTFNSLGSSCK